MAYSKEEVYEKSLAYFKEDPLATNVWIDKYCLKDTKGQLLEVTPNDMHNRLASEFSRIENKYPNPVSEEAIYNLLQDWTIIPGGSVLYGLGNKYSYSTLGNCFVIGNQDDSYGGIMLTDQEQVQLMKRRAGVGHDISHLRGSGSPVSNSAGTSSGIVPFMERYSNSTREVAQDGRRGALMETININHPQVLDFITAKDDLTKVTGANISVKIDDNFMQMKDKMLGGNSWRNNTWNKLIHQAWKGAEPGVLFWDKIKLESPAACYGKDWEETATNPCGEIPLCPYDSCRLLSVNLYNFVDNPFEYNAIFNWDKFKEVTYIAQKLMDDIIDLEEEKINLILEKIDKDPEAEEVKIVERNLWNKIKTKLLQGRRTGLSGIGLADVLAALNIGYETDTGISGGEEIYKQLAITAYKSSIDMAKDRGAFPIWKYKTENNNPFLKRIYDQLRDDDWFQYQNTGRRNIALLTIPPSGTIK